MVKDLPTPEQEEKDRISKITREYYCAVRMQERFPERDREWWADAKREHDDLTTDDS